MVSLCIDTSYRFLAVCLINDREIVYRYCEECFKHQSEETFTVLQKMKESGVDIDSIDSICISIGPGSYTGVRIALTIAKTICSLKNLDLYVISTLKLYANNRENTLVLMDARAQRVYMGIYDNENVLCEDCIKNVSEVELNDYNLVGDLSLFEKENKYYDICDCFLNTINLWQKVEDVDSLAPTYLKQSEDYKR